MNTSVAFRAPRFGKSEFPNWTAGHRVSYGRAGT